MPLGFVDIITTVRRMERRRRLHEQYNSLKTISANNFHSHEKRFTRKTAFLLGLSNESDLRVLRLIAYFESEKSVSIAIEIETMRTLWTL